MRLDREAHFLVRQDRDAQLLVRQDRGAHQGTTASIILDNFLFWILPIAATPAYAVDHLICMAQPTAEDKIGEV